MEQEEIKELFDTLYSTRAEDLKDETLKRCTCLSAKLFMSGKKYIYADNKIVNDPVVKAIYDDFNKSKSDNLVGRLYDVYKSESKDKQDKVMHLMYDEFGLDNVRQHMSCTVNYIRNKSGNKLTDDAVLFANYISARVLMQTGMAV